MIPSDLATRLQSTVDTSVRPAPQAREVANALSDLIPGQRVLAEIQALLPNGAYRAIINQRDITLALPFLAKAGDSLELEVVDNEGTLALALVSRRTVADEAKPGAERPAVETTLSRTGSFIAGLLGGSKDGDAAQPARLNANQPIAQTPPASGAELAPLLKQAVVQSGMFYEAHQSQWVAQQLPTEALLAQPQGRHSPILQNPAPPAGPGEESPAVPVPARAAEMVADRQVAGSSGERSAITPTASTLEQAPGLRATGSPMVAPDLVPLVQQQLEALASQTYVWQGQAWPGQQMRWEIEEDGHRNEEGKPDAETQWQTRLSLTMPALGEVRAALRLSGSDIALNLSAADADAARRLDAGIKDLRSQLEAAGLSLSGIRISQHEPEES